MRPPDNAHLVEDFRAQIRTTLEEGGPDAFFSWFDHQKGEEAAFEAGEEHFSVTALRGLPAGWTPTGTALEIGYGGGRLLAAAARRFDKAIGVDIHDCGSVVEDALQRRGIANVELLVSDGRTLPVPDGSIDFAFSFIVFIHLTKESAVAYIAELGRVMKPGGMVSLWFGRTYPYRPSDFKGIKRLAARAIYIAEPLIEPRYRVFPARANGIALGIGQREMRRLSISAGFQVLSISRKPDWVQSQVVLRKR